MAQKSISGNVKLAEAIKNRRNELNLTIEEAAKRAGVGTKTWSRYEAGESIRQDKYKGVCKALNWMQLPTEENENELDLGGYKDHEAWSKYLEENFGDVAALSFAIGSDILLDHIQQDMDELSKFPKGTHIGELGTSFIEDILPEQFLMNYDYEFLYAMRSELIRLRKIARAGAEIIAHSVMTELILHMIVDESDILIDNDISLAADEDWSEWIYDIFDDADIDMCLFSDMYIPSDNIYHFSHWAEQQFYCE